MQNFVVSVKHYDPLDCNLPGSSIHGILQMRILEWVAMPTLPDPGVEPETPMSLALHADSLPTYISSNSVQGFPFFFFFFFLSDNHSKRCVMITYHGFDFHFPNSDAGHLFMYLLDICMSSLEKKSIQLCFAQFLIELSIFPQSCMSSLYILNINPSSDVWFANIFHVM